MKLVAFIAVAVALAILGLSACGSDAEPEPAETTTVQTEQSASFSEIDRQNRKVAKKIRRDLENSASHAGCAGKLRGYEQDMVSHAKAMEAEGDTEAVTSVMRLMANLSGTCNQLFPKDQPERSRPAGSDKCMGYEGSCDSFYAQAQETCASYPVKRLAREFGAKSTDSSDVADAYAENGVFAPELADVIRSGCLAGLTTGSP